MKIGKLHKRAVMLTCVVIVIAVGAITTVNNSSEEEIQQLVVSTDTTHAVTLESPTVYMSNHVETTEEAVETVDKPVDTAVETVENSAVLEDGVDCAVDDANSSVDTSLDAELEYTEEQHEILAIIIYQEAGGDRCSDDTRRKVGSVFLNRVSSPLFPDTFEEVATQKSQYGSLSSTGIKWPNRASNAGEAHAVGRAYNIAEELLIEGSTLPSNVIWQAEFPQGDGTHSHQDNFYFCYSEVNE